MTKNRPARREDLDAFVTVAEACELLAISTRTLRRWKAAGRIQFTFTTRGRGGRALVRVDRLRRLMDEMDT